MSYKLKKDIDRLPLSEVGDGSLLVTSKQAAKILSCGESSLARKRSRGTGPHYHKLGRSVRYHLNDLFEYMKSKKVETEGGY